MKYILMLDGGFLKKKYYKAFNHEPSASDIKRIANSIISKYLEPNCSLLRIYYYDSPPLKMEVVRPVSHTILDLSKTPAYHANVSRLAELKRMDFFAVREGRLTFRGWNLKDSARGKSPASLLDNDFSPNIQQKGVDMKIGLDIAWISFNKIVDRILVATGDSDFIPAMKLARRNGVQVFLLTLNHGVAEELKDHADRLIEDSVSTF